MKGHCNKCGVPIWIPIATNPEEPSVSYGYVRLGHIADDLAFFVYLCGGNHDQY